VKPGVKNHDNFISSEGAEYFFNLPLDSSLLYYKGILTIIVKPLQGFKPGS